MAEILLSLTIIGVVAAITLPSLTGNINERTWNTQRKALYARFSQAFSLMPSLNGYGTLDDTTDTAAETFVTAGLSKVLKINNICDNQHFSDCGVNSHVTNFVGSKVDMPPTLHDLNASFSETNNGHNHHSFTNKKAVAFETQNGESIVVYYNPTCKYDKLTTYESDFIQNFMCANFIFDLNGLKGPNTVGKDIGFITVYHPVDGVVASPRLRSPQPQTIHTWHSISKICRDTYDSSSRAIDFYEAASVWVNSKLWGVADGTTIFSSSKVLNSNGKMYWRTVNGNGLQLFHLYSMTEAGGFANTLCVDEN